MMLLPSCHDVQHDLTEYMEGSRPWTRRLGMWIHLRLCRVCAGVLRGLRALPGTAKVSLAPPAAPPEIALKALAEVQAALRNPKG